MQRISISEFRARASEILRSVRHAQSGYMITHRGQPAAQLMPLAETEPPPAFSANENWDELTRLGQKIAEGWPAGVSSGDILSELR